MANYCDNDLRATLRHNLGRVCTVYTTHSPDAFTGVLSELDGNSCKLISLHHARDSRCDDCDFQRRIMTIPVDKISCLATSQY